MSAVEGVGATVDAAVEAFGQGDFAAAAEAAERLVELHNHPAGHRIRGDLAYLDDDLRAARTHYELAFRGLRDAGDLAAAARIAIELAELHEEGFANHAAARGWLGRARRLLDRVGPCVEWGYLELAILACFRPDALELEASADRALAIAEEYGDHDLEVRALADGGLALVTQGRLQEGFARLDEAMAALTAGEVRDLAVAGRSFCALLTSCERVGDVGRAEEWMRVVNEVALAPTGGRPSALRNHCRLVYGSVLTTAGRWSEAEAAILELLTPAAMTGNGHLIESTCHLAGVRIEQGRLEEAAALLAPYEDHDASAEPLARLHLRSGDAALAAATVQRGLRALVGDALRGAPLLARLVEAELLRGDVVAAADAADRLRALADRAGTPALLAEAAIAAGRVARTGGDLRAAAAAFESAAGHVRGGWPLLAGTAHLELAETLAGGGDVAAAIAEARAASAAHERLGARAGADRAAALLRSLGATSPARTREHRERAAAALTTREAEVLALIREGCSNATIAGRLYISPKTAEHHVGRVLAKLGVRSRAEAAAVAATLDALP